MNDNRRKRIQALQDQLEEIHTCLTEIQEEEQGAFDNLPEGFQMSERGEKMEQSASDLEEAANSVEEAKDTLDTVINNA